MLSNELLTELDEAFQMHFAEVEDYLFVDEHDGWQGSMEKYQEAVVDIFDKYICEKTWVEDLQQAVRTMLPCKLEWIFMNHQFHHGAVLLIMTVSTINALVRCLDRVVLAIQEVHCELMNVMNELGGRGWKLCNIRAIFPPKWGLSILAQVEPVPSMTF